MSKNKNCSDISQEIIDKIRSAEIFNPLNDEETRIIASHSAVCAYQTGDTIFAQNDRSSAFFIVASGSIHIIQKNDEGKSSIIAELLPGDSFGELEYLMGSPRNASAVAAADTSLITFPPDETPVEKHLADHPVLHSKLLLSFLRVIAKRLRSSNALIKENSPWVRELKNQVYGDKLTGLYNKTYLEEELPGMLSDSNTPVSLLLMKPDNFKFINDTYGHEAGDGSLKLMASELSHRTGESGVCLKYMGNELGVIMRGAGRAAALRKAEEIRAAFNALDVRSVTGGAAVTITVSIGIAVWPEHGHSAEEIISAAHSLPLVGRERGGNLILFPEDVK